MNEIILTDVTFEKEVLETEKTVLVDFFATWCGPCKLIAPLLSEIAEENAETVKLCKLDVDCEPALAQAFGITSIPTVMAFKDGQITGTVVGYTTKDKLLELI
ncbi:MAG: thioredoxin [Clostridia bacterium]|nr:thioredoxin [Clostridia bacterium]